MHSPVAYIGKGERCKLPQWAANAFACILGWEIAANGDECPSSAWPYMGVSNTFPKLGRVHYGMDPIGLRKSEVVGSGLRTQDPGGNRRLWLLSFFTSIGRPGSLGLGLPTYRCVL